MKISNKKNVESTGAFLLCLFPMVLFALITHLMVHKKVDLFVYLNVVMLATLLFTLLRLEYSEFEDSGLVITYQKKRILSNACFGKPVFEFPKDQLTDYQVKNKNLYLHIKSQHSFSEKLRVFLIDLTIFSAQQSDDVLSSVGAGKPINS